MTKYEPHDAASVVKRWRPSADTVSQRVGTDMVLVNLRTDQIFELNETGARIWDLLATGSDLAGIEQRLVQEYDVRESEVRGQVDALLRALREAELLQAGDSD